MTGEPWTAADGGGTIGLVDRRSAAVAADADLRGRVASTLEGRPWRVVAGDAAAVVEAGPAFVVAAGESAVGALARAGVEAPVLPVAAGRGVRSVDAGNLQAAVAGALAGEYAERDRPLLSVSPPDADPATAVFDAALVTTEPAHISEYRVDVRGDRVARFRADGVVVATPAGSRGYAGAAGGPAVDPRTGAGAVVPIAPFSVDAGRWVVPLDGLSASVLRDDGAVELLVDDRSLGPVAVREPVTVEVTGSLSLLVGPESASFYDD